MCSPLLCSATLNSSISKFDKLIYSNPWLNPFSSTLLESFSPSWDPLPAKSLHFCGALVMSLKNSKAPFLPLKPFFSTQSSSNTRAVDDLIDDFSYETLRRQVMTRNERKGRNQVRIFFSKSNQIAFRLKMGHKIKQIRETLNAINDDKNQFSFSGRLIDSRCDGFRERRETGSYIPQEEVIGRNDDKDKVLDLLLNNSNTTEYVVVACWNRRIRKDCPCSICLQP